MSTPSRYWIFAGPAITGPVQCLLSFGLYERLAAERWMAGAGLTGATAIIQAKSEAAARKSPHFVRRWPDVA